MEAKLVRPIGSSDYEHVQVTDVVTNSNENKLFKKLERANADKAGGK